MASAVCADATAANTGAELVTPAQSSTGDLQAKTHSQHQQRRGAVCAATEVPPGSMCEAPDACWPSTSTSEASPSPACIERPTMQQEDSQAASQPPQQHQNTKISGAVSGEQQAMLQTSSAASGRSGSASSNTSSNTDSGSGAVKGSSNRLRRDSAAHPPQAGSGGNNNTTTGNRQQHLTIQHPADPHACSSPRAALSVDVAAAAAAAATAAISPSPKQQQGANGRLSSPVPNGYMRASLSKQPQASAQMPRTFSPSPDSTGNAAAEVQQPLQIQFGDVPLGLGSPRQHAASSPVQLPDSSSAANGRPLDVQQKQQRHDHVHAPQDSSSTHNGDGSAAAAAAAADNQNPSAQEPSRTAAPDAGNAQRGTAEPRQGSSKANSVGSRKQHVRGGSGQLPGLATGQEQVERSITPQASPKTRQRHAQQHRQGAEKQPSKQALANVAGKPSEASPGSPGPALSPALLKQFGLPIGPMNGCTAVGEEQIRATIHSAAPMVLVAKDGSCFTPEDDSCQSLTCNDAEGSSQSDEQVPGSPSKGPIREQGKRDHGSPAGRSQHKQGNGHQPVRDAGVDDCSSSSSSLPAAANITAAATRSSSGPVVNAWQQHESAAVALQLTTPGSSQGQQHQGRGKGHSSTAAWLQQQQQPRQQAYGSSVGLSSSSPQLSHMDRSDIMSDPGTVPGGGCAALGFDVSGAGYGRNKAGGRHNRFMTHHVQHQQQGSHGGLVGQLPNMQHLSSTSPAGGRQGINREEAPGSGGPRKAGGGIGGRKGSKGSIDVYMPRSPQITAQAASGGSGGNPAGGRRSFDVRFYQNQQGGAPGQQGHMSRSSSTNGRQTPLLSPNGTRRQQQQGSSPPLPPSSSTSSLPGQPSPLLLPESALLPLGSSQRPSSSSSGMQAMPDLPPSAAGSLAPSGPCTDLERLLVAIGPTIQVNQSLTVQQARDSLTLKSVWDLFLEPSLWGLPVPTLGGPRGQSTAYYVPYMSAMQLFTRIEEPMSPAVQPGASTTTAPTSSSSPSSTSGAAASSSSAASSCGSGSASPSMAGSSGSSCPSYAAAVAAGTAASIGGASPAGGGDPGPTVAAPASPGGQQQQQQQLLTAVPAAAGPGGRGRLYSCNHKGWPRTMRLLLEHMEQELPFSRDPLYLQLEAMSGGQAAAEAVEAATAAAYRGASRALAGASSPSPATATGGFTACGYPLVGPDLMGTKLADVHPASWFAVAWYPVYRIPDAPLTARFLAFYSFRQLQDVLQGALSAAAGNASARCQLGGLPMPVVGLKWYNTMTERWLDVLAASSSSGRNSSNGGSAAQPEAMDNSADDSVQVLRMSQARLAEWHARLDDLQGTAARLAKGMGLKVLTPQGSKDVRLYHSDYEFFNSRS